MAKQIARIAQEFDEETDPILAAGLIQQRLFSYADSLTNWATDVAKLMLERASKADYDTWLEAGQNIGRATRQRLQDAAIGPVFDQLQASQVDLITSLPREASMKVHEWVRDGLAKGQRYPDIVKRIKSELPPVVEFRAVCIARTESARARSNFTEARAKAVGSTHYVWHTVGDGAVRESHAALDGTIQAWDSPPITDKGKGGVPERAHPGCIWNCFPGDTLVYIPKDLIRVIRAPFNGCVVEINCAGTVVTATPNHPMLTQRGWVAAGEIRQGDYLLKPVSQAVGMIKANEYYGIARIDKLFDALSREVVGAPGVHFDFYGDVPDGDVDTAVIDGSLGFDFMSDVVERLGDFDFSGTSGVMGSAFHDLSDVSGSGRFGKVSPLIEAQSLHANNVGIGTVTDSDAAFFEALVNGIPANSDGIGQSQDTFPGLVTADDLTNIQFQPVVRDVSPFPFEGIDSKRSEFERKNIGRAVDCNGGRFDCRAVLYQGFRVQDARFRNLFSGHVYTLETKKGWYGVTPHNFTVKNCRCWAEPLFPKTEYDK